MKTLILGASDNPSSYAYLAANRLLKNGHQIINIGIKSGEVAGFPIERAQKIYPNVDTITMYIGPLKQAQYYNYIIKTMPRRIIFNPGTENPELELLAKEAGIIVQEACTLVLLSTNQY